MQPIYVNPFTDFGFKKIFGEDASKESLIDFLNALLPNQTQIVNLTFKNTENLGQKIIDRKAIYDIYCENERGEKFIVELQKAKQDFFRERMVYYSTFPITEQAEKGTYWNYKLKAVYCIGILDFIFNDYQNEEEKKRVLHIIDLKDQFGKTFYEKLTYIYIEMPNFNKSEDELETRLDKWLYFIKNLEEFEDMPKIFKDEIPFVKAFEKAAISKYTKDELAIYNNNVKVYRDLRGAFDTATREGMELGIKEGILIGKIKGKEEE